MDPDLSFSVSLVADGGSTLVDIDGELDNSTAPQLLTAMRRLAVDGEAVVLDLRDVPFMDSGGVTALVVAARMVREQGGRLTIENLQRQPAAVLQLTGVLDALRTQP